MSNTARWDQGEIISTASTESTVNLVVSKRFAKKQQMQWSKKSAHRLLQTHTRTLDGTLRDLFTTWYPAMPANDVRACPSLPQREQSPTVSVALLADKAFNSNVIRADLADRGSVARYRKHINL